MTTVVAVKQFGKTKFSEWTVYRGTLVEDAEGEPTVTFVSLIARFEWNEHAAAMGCARRCLDGCGQPEGGNQGVVS